MYPKFLRTNLSTKYCHVLCPYTRFFVLKIWSLQFTCALLLGGVHWATWIGCHFLQIETQITSSGALAYFCPILVYPN